MATKKKQNEAVNNKPTATETWRKPLQVPPRADAMRSFYQGAEDKQDLAIKQENAPLVKFEKTVHPVDAKEAIDPVQPPPQLEQQSGEEAVEKTEIRTSGESFALQNDESIAESIAGQSNKLNAEELSLHLGFEIEELFDVYELLRGKSFDIYRALMLSRDENGRCKITQPELMERTGIKNRRTFYKHEEWLINLKLLEKRHMPGDHKGVVYRVFEMSAVLPLPSLVLEQFAMRLNNPE